MRFIIAIVSISIVACFQPEKKHRMATIAPGYWISKNLKHYTIDSSLGGTQTLYGSGYLLKLDSSGHATSLGADFFWKNDTLYQGGEPGITLMIGNWQSNDHLLLLSQKLISKTFMLPGENLGQSELDSLELQQDGFMNYKGDTLIPVKKHSKALQLSIDKMMAFYHNKNGS